MSLTGVNAQPSGRGAGLLFLSMWADYYEGGEGGVREEGMAKRRAPPTPTPENMGAGQQNYGGGRVRGTFPNAR